MNGVGSYIGGMIVLLAGAIGCPIIAYKKYRNVVGVACAWIFRRIDIAYRYSLPAES